MRLQRNCQNRSNNIFVNKCIVKVLIYRVFVLYRYIVNQLLMINTRQIHFFIYLFLFIYLFYIILFYFIALVNYICNTLAVLASSIDRLSTRTYHVSSKLVSQFVKQMWHKLLMFDNYSDAIKQTAHKKNKSISI